MTVLTAATKSHRFEKMYLFATLSGWQNGSCQPADENLALIEGHCGCKQTAA